MAKRKSTNNDFSKYTHKTKIDEHGPHWKLGMNTGAPEGWAVPALLVAPVVWSVGKAIVNHCS
jgi:hypothetical protein